MSYLEVLSLGDYRIRADAIVGYGVCDYEDMWEFVIFSLASSFKLVTYSESEKRRWIQLLNEALES